jgi:Sec-independent protein translocase protein TatA
MDTIRPWEVLIIVVVVGLLFGADRLPQIAAPPWRRHL